MLKRSLSDTAQLEQAEAVAANALGFIAADEDRMQAFLLVTGIAPDDLRKTASQPVFLASVLQHVLSDEAMAAAFAEQNHFSPEDLHRAAYKLGIGWG